VSRAVVVRYRVKPEALEENVQLVRAVFAELAQQRPAGLRYRTARVDECTFVHLAVIEGDTNPLETVDAFRAFTATLGERCEEGPLPSTGELIGSYG
jgi:hypothetical protein